MKVSIGVGLVVTCLAWTAALGCGASRDGQGADSGLSWDGGGGRDGAGDTGLIEDGALTRDVGVSDADGHVPDWLLDVALSGNVIPVAGLEGVVDVRCLVRDAMGRRIDPDVTLTLEAPQDATDLGSGSFSFSEPGDHVFRCVAKDSSGTVLEVSDATVLVASSMTPPAWARVSLHAGAAAMALDEVLDALEGQDASRLLDLADRLDAHLDAVNRVIQADIPAAYPLPYGGPTEDDCLAAGIQPTPDDSVLGRRIQESEDALDALLAVLENLSMDSDPSQQELDRLEAAMEQAAAAARQLRGLDLSACRTMEQVDLITAFLRQHVGPLQAAVLSRDATMVRSAARVFSLPSRARPFLSLAGLSAQMSLSQAMYGLVMDIYGPAFTWITEAAFTIELANLIDAVWDADLENGPEILAEASHGGVADICANYPVLLMGQRFDTNASRVDRTLIRLIIVSGNEVDVVESMLDLLHCPDSGKGLLQNLYECLGKFDDVMDALDAAANDFNPTIDEATSDGGYQWITINHFPRQPSSLIPEPVFIFPFSSLTGKGERFSATLYHCQ